MTLDEMLDDIVVVEKDSSFSGHDTWPDEYPYGVYDTEACLGLFPSMKSALQYRLMVINQRLNDGWDKHEEAFYGPL